MKYRSIAFTVAFSFFFTGFLGAVDIPNGLLRTAEEKAVDTVELLVGPGILLSPGAAYLLSEVRYQASDDFSTGVSFGAGKTGFSTGTNGSWYLVPDTAEQPAICVLGGVFFNQVNENDYFVVKMVPIVSKHVATTWGSLTPYGGLHIAPTFRLNVAQNLFSSRLTGGSEFHLKALGEGRLWAEVNVNITNSQHSIMTGYSLPVD